MRGEFGRVRLMPSKDCSAVKVIKCFRSVVFWMYMQHLDGRAE